VAAAPNLAQREMKGINIDPVMKIYSQHGYAAEKRFLAPPGQFRPQEGALGP
jgi:hypothetical protein